MHAVIALLVRKDGNAQSTAIYWESMLLQRCCYWSWWHAGLPGHGLTGCIAPQRMAAIARVRWPAISSLLPPELAYFGTYHKLVDSPKWTQPWLEVARQSPFVPERGLSR